MNLQKVIICIRTLQHCGHKVTQKTVAKITGLAPRTIGSYWKKAFSEIEDV